ncbi:MAG: hypothetical protein H6818_04805 [Phycisphaerales bacterium]|nr:hypothetical protein [Phycisphaerales bacterium]
MTKRFTRMFLLCFAFLCLNSACLSIKAPERIDLGGRGDRSHHRDRDRDDRRDRKDRDDDDRYDHDKRDDDRHDRDRDDDDDD